MSKLKTLVSELLKELARREAILYPDHPSVKKQRAKDRADQDASAVIDLAERRKNAKNLPERS